MKKKKLTEKQVENENDKAEQFPPDVQTEKKVEKKPETAKQNDNEFIPDGELTGEKFEKKSEEKSEEKINEFQDLNSLLEQYSDEPENSENTDIKKPRKKRTTKNKEPEKPAMIIPGKLFVLVNDRVLTGLISAIDSWVSKNPIDSELLQLQSDQMEDLAPLAEVAMKEMNLQDNPIAMFYGTLGAIYISNYMAIKALILKSKNNENI